MKYFILKFVKTYIYLISDNKKSNVVFPNFKIKLLINIY